MGSWLGDGHFFHFFGLRMSSIDGIQINGKLATSFLSFASLPLHIPLDEISPDENPIATTSIAGDCVRAVIAHGVLASALSRSLLP